MSTFKPLESLLDALSHFKKGASKEDVILYLKLESSENEKSIRQAFYNAKNAGLIYSKTDMGERYWHLTEMGKARHQGKELKLSHTPERITQADIDKTITEHGGVPAKASLPQAASIEPAINQNNFGATFNSDGKLCIWHGHDEVVFNPPQAAQLIAFIANQMPWIEYVKLHGTAA